MTSLLCTRSSVPASGATMTRLTVSYLQQHHHHSLQGNTDHAVPRAYLPALATGSWSTDEDARLRQGVLNHGTRWVVVASEVGTRSGEQCAKRWNDNVNPDLNHSSWSPDEDQALLALVACHGHNWKLMAQGHLQFRPPLAIKNRYALLMRRQKRETSRLQQRSFPRPRHVTVHPTANTNDSTQSQIDSSNGGSIFSVQERPSTFSLSTSSPAGTQPNTMFDPEYPLSLSSMFSGAEHDVHGTRIHDDVSQTDATIYQNHDKTWSGDELELDRLVCGSEVGIRHVSGSSNEAIDLETPDRRRIDDKGVEFSVTCSRAKLKGVVCHAFEGALMEADAMSEQTPFTVTLRLHK